MLALALGVCYTMYVNEREDLKMTAINYFQPMAKISDVCETLDIPYTMSGLYSGYQIRFPWTTGDIICHEYSYSSDDGYVETMNFSWDDDNVSVLTVEEAIVYLILEYNNYKKSKN